MDQTLVAATPHSPEKRLQKQELPQGVTAGPRQLTKVQLAAAKLYGRGHDKEKILVHMAKKCRCSVKVMRRRLMYWERWPEWRDAVWEQALADADLATPAVMRSLAIQAQRGKVQEAKFFLELIGRYTPAGGDFTPTVHVVIGGIPRPDPEAEPTVVEGVVEEAEFEVLDSPRPDLTARLS